MVTSQDSLGPATPTEETPARTEPPPPPLPPHLHCNFYKRVVQQLYASPHLPWPLTCIHRLLAWHAMLPGLAGSMFGGGSLWYRTDCCTLQTVLLGAVRVPARPAAWQIFSYKWGAACWGEYHMFMLDWSGLKAPSRPCTLGSLCTLL